MSGVGAAEMQRAAGGAVARCAGARAGRGGGERARRRASRIRAQGAGPLQGIYLPSRARQLVS